MSKGKALKDDNLLLEEINQDKAGAIEELIEKYRGSVEAIAMKYIKSPLERDDLIQEGMIGLLASIKSYKSEKGVKFATYASTCINNSIQTAIMKFSRRKSIPSAKLVGLEEEVVGTQLGLSAEEEYLAKESVSILTELLADELSDFENRVLRLYMVGCSYNEIAERLGKNPKAIDNAMQRIRKKLNCIEF